MSDLTRAVPVEKWGLTLDNPIVDEAAALEGWHRLVRAQGWSPVGGPEVIGNEHAVIGRVVRYPGITVTADIRNAITVPRA